MDVDETSWLSRRSPTLCCQCSVDDLSTDGNPMVNPGVGALHSRESSDARKGASCWGFKPCFLLSKATLTFFTSFLVMAFTCLLFPFSPILRASATALGTSKPNLRLLLWHQELTTAQVPLLLFRARGAYKLLKAGLSCKPAVTAHSVTERFLQA